MPFCYKLAVSNLITALLTTLILTVWLSPVGDAQELAKAKEYESDGRREYKLAREEALTAYLKDEHGEQSLPGLRCYIRNAIRTGRAGDAIQYSTILINRTENSAKIEKWVDLSNHVKCLLYAGRLKETQPFVAQVMARKSIWESSKHADKIQSALDYAIEREVAIEFVINPNLVEGQAHLAPNIWIPIPWQDSAYSKSSLEVIGAESFECKQIDEAEFLIIKPIAFDQPITVKANVHLMPVDHTPEMSKSKWGYPESLKVFTLPSFYVDSEDKSVVEIARSVADSSLLVTVRNVFRFCSEEIHFVPLGDNFSGGGKASEVLARRYAHCEGGSQLAVAMLRANNIPARLVRGHSSVTGDSPNASHHTIVEYYLDNIGWILWDWGQSPGVVPANFVPLWSYPNQSAPPEPTHITSPLHSIQRLGLNGKSYMNAHVTKRVFGSDN